jgi:hypothetical protein
VKRLERSLQWIVVGLLLAHAVALNAWPVAFYGDDLLYVRLAQEHADSHAADFLTFRDGAMRRYRPLTKLFLVQSYRAFGVKPTLVRAATTLTLALTVLGVLALAKAAGLRASTGYLASALFLVHQMPVSVLYRNGRMEQHFTLAGLLALLAVERAYRSRDRPVERRLWLAVIPAALIVGFLWSEAALCFAAVVPLWAGVRTAFDHEDLSHRERIRFSLGTATLAFGAAAAFLAWYWAIGAPLQGRNRYLMGLGPATLDNLVTSVAAWVTPVSSIAVVRWMRAPSEHLPALSVTALLSALVLWCLYRGGRELARSDPRKLMLALLCLASAFVCLFPVALTQHMGEPYVYSSVLMFCLAAAILVGEPFLTPSMATRQHKGLTLLVLLLVAGVVAGHVHASVQKISLSRRNGVRLQRLTHQLEHRARAQDSGVVYLIDRSDQESFGQLLMPVRLVYGTGAGEPFEVQWVVSGATPPATSWVVRDDGSIEPWAGLDLQSVE